MFKKLGSAPFSRGEIFNFLRKLRPILRWTSHGDVDNALRFTPPTPRRRRPGRPLWPREGSDLLMVKRG